MKSSLFQLSIKGTASKLSRLEEVGFEMRVVLSSPVDVWKRVIQTADFLHFMKMQLHYSYTSKPSFKDFQTHS